MVKLTGILFMFLFIGCTSQDRKQSVLSEFAKYSSNVIQYNNVAGKMPATLSSPEFLAPVGKNAGFYFNTLSVIFQPNLKLMY